MQEGISLARFPILTVLEILDPPLNIGQAAQEDAQKSQKVLYLVSLNIDFVVESNKGLDRYGKLFCSLTHLINTPF